MLELGKFSLGVGDRFGCQAEAQLRACVMAAECGVEIVPVWNKSHREHTIIGSTPAATRAAADAAVAALGWKGRYHVDADHIGLRTVDGFLPWCDFFTIDVAEWIGQAADAADVARFVDGHREAFDRRDLSLEAANRAAAKYLLAAQEAGKTYRHIQMAKGSDFIAEISMDETDEPQTPGELLVILAAVADEKIPLQTIAPKFIGRFNKGVDYEGDVALFEKKFNEHLATIAFAIAEFGLPRNLKLSVHSGSDKFSIYGAMRRAAARFGAGLHVKTAGTTWLEELIGLAECGGAGLGMAREIYAEAREHMDELCAPYASVIAIDKSRLPLSSEVARWSSERFISALRHDPRNPDFNPHLRQLLHVSYKIAAQNGARYLALLGACREEVSRNVTANLFERHIKPLFLDRD